MVENAGYGVIDCLGSIAGQLLADRRREGRLMLVRRVRTYRWSLILLLAGLVVTAAGIFAGSHLGALRERRVDQGTAVVGVVVDAGAVAFGRTVRYPELEVRFGVDGVVRSTWLRAAREGQLRRPGDEIVVYVDPQHRDSLATRDGYVTERGLVVVPDSALALGVALVIFAGMAGWATRSRMRRIRFLGSYPQLSVVAVAGTTLRQTEAGELLDSPLWTADIDGDARATAAGVLKGRIEGMDDVLVEPLSAHTAARLTGKRSATTETGEESYFLIARR